MVDSFKICPTCGTHNPSDAVNCSTCKTLITNIAPTTNPENRIVTPTPYDFRYGESDLYENLLSRKAQFSMAAIVVFLVLTIIASLTLVFAPSLFSNLSVALQPGPTTTSSPRATLSLPSVTPAPPTLTPTDTASPPPTLTLTPTREPCMQTVQSGDGLYALAARCGHLSFDVINLIVETNNLPDANSLRVGQVIEIPWPTPTVDPNMAQTEQAESSEAMNNSSTSANDVAINSTTEDNEELLLLLEDPTATLQSDVMFHQITAGENILSIAVQYGANVEILSQLNPEMTFSQCDFGLDSGGPRCTVFVFEGQQIRVPAPTPTPTIQPTSSGSETPTPPPTATFNAPSPQSPSDRALFRRNEFITLRWSPTGTLGAEQVYRVQVEDITEGIIYISDTTDISFIIPVEWQGVDSNRHEFAWFVSVIDIDNPNTPYYTTQTLTFTWEGRQQEPTNEG